MSNTPTPEHGFKLLKQANDLKFDFNAAGPDGQISFAKACIWFGWTLPAEIILEACAIGGDHLEGPFENLLDEGENIHWRRCADGQLQLILN